MRPMLESTPISDARITRPASSTACPVADVLAPAADVRSRQGRLEDAHLVAARRRLARLPQRLVRLLEGHDRVRPRGDGRARHDAHRLALAHGRVEHVPRGQVRDHGQPCAGHPRPPPSVSAARTA